jgi:hypothetical protein
VEEGLGLGLGTWPGRWRLRRAARRRPGRGGRGCLRTPARMARAVAKFVWRAVEELKEGSGASIGSGG